jgi:CheY-like chemotaxis protein
VRKGLVQLLQDAGFEVKGAGDGMDAIRVMETFKPHLVCTDMEMPNMNGLELTQHLRLEEATRDLPVIMITSRSMEKHRQQAMSVGVDAYLTKPYTEAELLKHVQNAIQAGSSHAMAESA